MASLRADDDPQASEYAGKDSPDDSDNDEGLYVETNANVTKLLTTQGTHDLDTMKHMLHTMRVQYEAGSLTKEECDRFASFVESSLDVLAHISEGATDTAPVEVQENKCADGAKKRKGIGALLDSSGGYSGGAAVSKEERKLTAHRG